MPSIQLINPNTSQRTTDTMVAIARASAPSGWTIEGITAPFGVALITNAQELEIACQAVCSLGQSLKADGVIVAA